jgi:hypothetical protein
MSVGEDERLIRTVFERAAEGRAMLSTDMVHEEAVVIPHADPPVALTGNAIISFIEAHRHELPMYEAHAQEIRQVGPSRFVVVGRIRMSRGAGFADTPAAWAIVIKDGKLFRVKGTSTAEEAIDVLRTGDWRPVPC